MRDRAIARWSAIVAASAGMCLGTTAMAVDTPETEPNDSKAAANVVTLSCGDSVSGVTTGTSTTVAGGTSVDYFRITSPTQAPGVYKYTLTLASATAGHTATLRGLNQSGGVIGTTDTTIQTGRTVGTDRVNTFYGFGNGGQLFYRVAGTTSTTGTYTTTLTCESAPIIDLTGTVSPGSVTIAPDAATDTAADVDFWLYDSSFNAIPAAGHDDADAAGLTLNLGPGTYYLAYSNFNTANNQPTPVGDTSLAAAVMDFANVVANTSTTSISAMNVQVTSGAGTATGSATRTTPFDVVWYRFTVAVPNYPTAVGSAVLNPVPQGSPVTLTLAVTPANNSNLDNITSIVANVSAISGNPGDTAVAFTRVGVTANWTYTIAAANGNPGTRTATYTITDPVAAGGNGTGNINATIQVTNDTCLTATAIAVGQTAISSNVGTANETPTPPTCNGFSTFNLGVWYTFTEGATARRLQATTCNAVNTVNTRVYVYSGSCAGLTCVSANAVASPACSARADAATVNFCTVPGTQYFFLVTNDTTGTGDFGFSLFDTGAGCGAPANDTCATAVNITTVPSVQTPFVDFATADADVSCNAAANVESRAGVWYTYTPTEPGRFSFVETGTADVVFTIFTGPNCSTLSEVFCNTDEAGTVFFTGTVGTQYYIMCSMASNTAVLPTNYGITINYLIDPGACCNGTSCTITAGNQACVGSGGSFQGYGTNCGGGPLAENSNETDVSIPDFAVTPSPVSSSVVVADTTVITDLNVLVRMNHTFIGDVYVRLTGPNGTTIDLIKRPNVVSPCTAGAIGDSDDMVGNYTFDDDAPASLHAATIDGDATIIIASGNYRPTTCTGTFTSLDAASPAGFGGISAAGTWTLTVSDEDEAIVGTLEGFGIIINGVEANTPCTAAGACCRGTTCSALAGAACVGANTSYSGNGTVCNVFGVNNTTPCCFANYNQAGGVTVQDIFDFLAAYFSADNGADINGGGLSVQDIFDFLAAYFTGCA